MEKGAKSQNSYAIDQLLKNMGNNVARFKTAKGYTLDRLSKESGVAISRISEIESGVAEDIQLSTVTKLAQALGSAPFALLGTSNLDLTPGDYEHLEQAIELLLSIRHTKAKH
jgi:transcriptional regulator with XRE-family HTH domain